MKFRFYFWWILLVPCFNVTAYESHTNDEGGSSLTRRDIHHIKDLNGGKDLKFYLECIMQGIVPNNINLDKALLIACRYGVISDKKLREQVILFLLATGNIGSISVSTKDILLDVAIRHFSVGTVRYMLKKKLYDPSVMAGKRFHWKALKTFLPRLPKMFYWNYTTYFFSFLKSSLHFLELPVNIAYRILPIVLWVLSFSGIGCFVQANTIYSELLNSGPAVYKESFFSRYFPFLTFVLLISTFLSFAYTAWKYFRKPNYLILAIVAERENRVKERMAVAILEHMRKHGFYALERGFVLSYNKELKRLSDIMRLNKRDVSNNPWYIRALIKTQYFAYNSSYLYIGVDVGAVSALHMAKKYGLESVAEMLYEEDKKWTRKGKELAPAYWIPSTADVPKLYEEDRKMGRIRLINENLSAYLYALSEVFIGSAPFFSEPMTPADFVPEEVLEEDKDPFDYFNYNN